MKKFIFLLFVMILLAGCAQASPCPDWAKMKAGASCDTKNLSVTPDEAIVLANWEAGLVVLSGTRIDRVWNVKFYTPDGAEILPGSMSEFATYRFEKIGNQGSFSVLRSQDYNPANATNLILVKELK